MMAPERFQAMKKYPSSRELSPHPVSKARPRHKMLPPPESYVSDILMEGNYKTEAFSLQLDRFLSDACQTPFLCLALHLHDPEPTGDDLKKDTIWRAVVSPEVKARSGIMVWLSATVFAVAVPLPDTTTAASTARDFKRDMETKLALAISMGGAVFPCMAFTHHDIFHHAVRALDHAGFYPDGATVFVDAATFNIIGDRRYAMGHHEAALTEYQLGLLFDPADVNLLNSLGVCNSVLNRFEQALAQFEKIIDIIPEDIPALYNAGLTCHLMGDSARAARFLTRACRPAPPLYEIELTAGIVFAELNNSDKALKHLERAGTLKPRAGTPSSLSGDLHRLQGQFSRAVNAYTRAIKCNPRDGWAMSGLARTYEIQNTNLAVALSLAAQSIAMKPEIPRFYLRLGRIHLKNGDYDNACEVFTRGTRCCNLRHGNPVSPLPSRPAVTGGGDPTPSPPSTYKTCPAHTTKPAEPVCIQS